MRSPFPGMDPYLEAHGRLWPAFPPLLIGEIHRALAAVERYPTVGATGPNTEG